MGKLPQLSFADVPQWHRERLSAWLDEWETELRLRNLDSPNIMPSKILAVISSENTAAGEFVRNYDTDVSVGQIRLLSPTVLPQASQPVYIAVLSEWEDDMVVIAPFSPFSQPATVGELLSGRNEAPLRVLSAWNSPAIPRSAIASSWVVDDLSEIEFNDFHAILDHVTTGEPLPEHLGQRVGPPLTHPQDPRLQFQREQISMLAPLLRTAMEFTAFKHLAHKLYVLSPWPAGGESRDDRMAAESVKEAPLEFAEYAIGETRFVLRLLTQTDGKQVDITVLDATGVRSLDLDGSQFISRTGESVRITNGRAVCSRTAVVSDFTFVMPDASQPKLRHINQ